MPKTWKLEDFEEGDSFELVVRGKKVERPIKDAVAELQKGESANRKLEDINKQKRELDRIIDRDSAIQEGFRNKDRTALVRALRAHDFTDQEIETFLPSGNAQPPPKEEEEEFQFDGEGDQTHSAEVMALQGQVKKLTEALQSIQDERKKASEAQRFDEVRTTTEAQIKKALDQHPKIGQYLKGKTERVSENILAQAKGAIHRRLNTSEYLKWGPAVVQAGLDDLELIMTESGTLPSDDAQVGIGKISRVTPGGVHIGEDIARRTKDVDAFKDVKVTDSKFDQKMESLVISNLQDESQEG